MLGGNAINLGGNVQSAATGVQEIGNDLALQTDIQVNITADDQTSRVTLSGNISGNYGLTLSGTYQYGTSRVTLSGTNSYTGTLTVGTSGQTVTGWVTDVAAVTGDVVVADGSTLRLRPDVSSSTFSQDIYITGDGAESLGRATWAARTGAGALVLNNDVDVTGTVTLTGDSRISANRDDLSTSGMTGTISGKITGNYALQFGFVQERPGTITITNPDNDWTGDTTITGGGATTSSGRTFNFRLGVADALPFGVGKGNVTLGYRNTYVNTLGYDQSINGLNGAGGGSYITGGGTFSVGNADADGDYNGALTVTTLVKTGTGTQSLGGNTTASTATNVNGGTLVIDGGYLAGGAISVADGATLQLDGGELRYTSGTNLDLNSSGTLTFTSGTLTGTNWDGGLSGLTVGTGCVISPGTSPGAATSGDQDWADGGTYTFEINDATGSAGTNWDHLALSGDLDLSALTAGGFTISLISLDGTAAGEAANFDENSTYQWEIASFSTLTGTFDAGLFTVDTSAFQNPFTQTFTVDRVGDTLVLSYIPEPATLALLGIGATVLLRRRRQG